MSFVEKNLVSGERIVHEAHIHPIVYASGVFAVVLAIVGFGMGGDAGLVVGILLSLIGFGALFSAWLKVKTTEFAVTNRRVLTKLGLIRRRTSEMMLGKVESVDVQQGIIGRLLGFGAVVMTGSGGSRDPFPYIANPIALRRAVQEQSDRLMAPREAQQHLPSAAAEAKPDIADQLRKLGELRDQGVLTEEEFQAKKVDLLSRM